MRDIAQTDHEKIDITDFRCHQHHHCVSTGMIPGSKAMISDFIKTMKAPFGLQILCNSIHINPDIRYLYEFKNGESRFVQEDDQTYTRIWCQGSS
jgi:hypothetical protein